MAEEDRERRKDDWMWRYLTFITFVGLVAVASFALGAVFGLDLIQQVANVLELGSDTPPPAVGE